MTGPEISSRDVGAKISLRELAANIRTDARGIVNEIPTPSYFQQRDIIKYLQIVERRVLTTVMEFLESLDLDTGEYRDRVVSILNVGALNTGAGTQSVQNVATGTSAAVIGVAINSGLGNNSPTAGERL